MARVEVHAALFGQWHKTGDIWYSHVENIGPGVVGLGQQLATVSNGLVSSCWSAPHVHVEWSSTGAFGQQATCISSFPDLGEI